MSTNTKLLVTGAKGLVGSEIKGDVLIGREYDLRIFSQVDKMINNYSPTHIIHCAGKVGGIVGNISHMGEYFYDNLMINSNIIESSRRNNIEKLMVFSSTCVFPDNVDYPLNESKIHLGPPHDSNYGYAYAKRMADIQIRAYHQQYGLNYFSVIPCNVYGPNDNYNIVSGHVIPSLIHKAYLANKNNTDLIVWGSGKALREFIYSKDLAAISELLIFNYKGTSPIIISTGIEISIEEIAYTICDIIKFKNKIVFDRSKPEGQLRKPSDNSYLKSIIGQYKFTPIRQGLEETIEHFIKNYNLVRK